MGVLNNTSYVAFVGIDWADTKHDVCVQAADGDEREFDVIPHQVERIDEWAHALHRRFGSPIAVAVELSKGPIVYALQKYDFIEIFPINPTTLANYRSTFHPSGAKDDPTDAEAVDANVLAGCRAGERDAQHRLYELCHRQVYGLMVRMVGVQDAVDVTQQVFLQLFATVTLVFDGPMPEGGLAKQMQPAGIRVLFSAPETADDIIVRIVQAALDPAQLHVVSSDTAIRYEAGLRRCKHSDSATFITTLFPPAADQPETQAEQPEKPDVVPPQDASEWLDVFGNHEDEEPPFDGYDAMRC